MKKSIPGVWVCVGNQPQFNCDSCRGMCPHYHGKGAAYECYTATIYRGKKSEPKKDNNTAGRMMKLIDEDYMNHTIEDCNKNNHIIGSGIDGSVSVEDYIDRALDIGEAFIFCPVCGLDIQETEIIIETYNNGLLKYQWGKGSTEEMTMLDERGVRVLNRALGYGIMDMSVVCTVRGRVEQEEAFWDKSSKLSWPNSRHNVTEPGQKSLAWDVVPWVNGASSYNIKHCAVMVGLMLAAANEEGVPVRSGANWDMDGEFITDQDFVDAVHFEIVE